MPQYQNNKRRKFGKAQDGGLLPDFTDFLVKSDKYLMQE